MTNKNKQVQETDWPGKPHKRRLVMHVYVYVYYVFVVIDIYVFCFVTLTTLCQACISFRPRFEHFVCERVYCHSKYESCGFESS